MDPNSSQPSGPGRQPALGYAAPMAITHDPASITDRDLERDTDSIVTTGQEQAVELELELVEEISIDGMCGVY